MATEEELIRQLRVLYGISPEGADRQSFDGELKALQDRMSLTPETIEQVSGYTHGGLNRGGGRKVTTVANPARAALQQQILELNKKRNQGPDRSLTTEAGKNASMLDSIFGGIRRSTLDEGTRELNNRFTGTLRANTSSMAARGLTGGSAARSTQGRTLADLLLGRQRLAGAADAADQSSRIALDEQRQATERQIKLGTQPDLATIDSLKQAQVGVNQAYRGLTEQALGGLLVSGSNTYRDMNQADASGRRGFGGVAPTPGRATSASGRIY